ncbi:hypothetical protein PHYSODRAFT_534757 [Phytophthora sojae]|uniref:Cilia- and flagella-associated protein 69 ARM repeats domain-containing protein n=1 Tax=Phytophthora sojae (strain P6497) TaxID=1094619 RepID=G5AHA9_PHYSP|nr:hypothetical protein PHYSODRAFT_534757 [Phytophthora sojae]EGZ05088.1 hypothetical protein PHYSODRAFT_534757 [Phytophthora sojae]|eukprot:XP_009539460.1 hypothetical protein PHYSODRAFT_534757 [Phytophthora sojae]
MSRRYLTPASASQRTATSSGDSSWESFQKLFASAADPQTQSNHARHLALTKNILYENELGWKVAELPLVSEMLKLLANKVLDGVPQFAEQLVLAVMRCCKPFIRQKSNEEITNPSLLHEILPTLGELLSFHDIEVQVAAAEALRVFATGACLPRVAPKTRNNNAEGKSDDLRVTPRIFSQNLMEETGTVDAIVAVMHDLFPDDEEQEMQPTENEPDAAEELENTEEQAATPNQEEEGELATNEAVQVEGTGVEVTPQDIDVPHHAKKPASAPPYGHKRDGDASLEPNEGVNEEISNGQVSARSSKPASAPSAVHRGSNSMGNASMDSSTELSHAKASGLSPGRTQQDKSSGTASAITASNQYYATNSDEDFEFKQMLWFLLAEISCDHQADLSELVQFRFMEVWLSYATANNGGVNPQQDQNAPSRASAHKYSTPQLQLLQWTALSVLNHVAPFVVDHFYEINGHVKLLEFLQLNIGSEDVLASAWLLMLQIAPLQPFFQAELGNLGAIETAMDVFEAPPSRHTFAIRRNAILSCASMCRNDDGSNRKRFRLANGVHALVQHLEFDPSHSVLEENILVGIIDAVRSCVIGDLESETAFINEDGVPKLLSILGSAPKALKHQTLAALAEICVNPAAIPSYQMWRCDQPGENNNASANEVLLRIYADEEAAEKRANQEVDDNKANSSAQSTNGLVASTNVRHSAFQSVTTCTSPFIVTPEASPSPPTRPESPAFARLKDALKAGQGLASEKQATRSILQLENHQLHPEVNLKAKIYSVLANVSFACETESLTPQDQVMLEIAKEYPTFKLGEMWQNVERALHAEGVRPIYADALYIRQNIEHAYNISVCTKLAQQEVFTRSRQQNTEQEDAFFEQILRQKHQEAQAEEFHRANRRQNSTMQLHLDAKKTRLEFMRRQDPAAFAAYESEERCLIREPPPEYVDEQEAYRALQQNEAELRGRLSTITRPRKHTI